MASKNLYHRRLVADSGSKACWICYKPATTVLITPDQDDWFHICPLHLKDTRFAVAKDAAEIAERKRKEELEKKIEKEIEAVKKEHEEKLRKKAAAKGKDKDDKKKDGDDKDEKEKEEKLKELEKKKDGEGKPVDDGPRIFELHKSFFQQRLKKKLDAELAKKSRDRVKNPNVFPTVPTGDPL